MAAKTEAWRLPKLLRLWGAYGRMDFLMITRDLKTFLSWTVADGLLNIAAVSGMLLLAQRFAGIGPWSKDQVIFLLGYGALTDGLVGTVFSYNVAFISRRIGRGQFDHTLIQPQPIWLSLLTEGFSPAYGLSTLLPGLGLMLWASRHLPLAASPAWLLLVALNLVSSALIVMAFQFLWGSLAFWSPRAAEEVNSATMRLIVQLKSYPLDGRSGVLTGGLLTLLPVGFVAWLPCRALLGLDKAVGAVWMTPLAALGFLALATLIFRQGMKQYGRTGSQRYSLFGHRR
ncbi:MAG TPA: ABC-2 family transporter protein [Chthonomonadaceae bacterium]|nr:ABC-2 family transporter protein [Chthonomonadaceae bacterium]